MQKKAVDNGNTSFIQVENSNPFTDQWMFLGTIQKVSQTKLDELYDANIVNKQHDSVIDQVNTYSTDSPFTIILTNKIVLPRNGLHPLLLKYLKMANLEEIALVFKGTGFYINTNINLLSIDCLDVPLPVEEFKEAIVWKIRVNKYDEEEGELFSEVTDYNFPLDKVTEIKKDSFYFSGIEKIKFRALDTNGFLHAVNLKPQQLVESVVKENQRKEPVPSEYVVIKAMRVPLSKINFLFGSVSFPLFIAELSQEITFEILNPDKRPEFAAIPDYFAKALKKKLIAVELVIKYTDTHIISATVKSADIDSINNHMIDSIRFEFVKREIFTGKGLSTDVKSVHTNSAQIICGRNFHYFDLEIQFNFITSF